MERQKHKILLIDDDNFLLDMYSLKFREEGFDVYFAKGGEDALTKLKNKEVEPEVILSDILMLGLNGFDLLEEIRKQNIAPDSKVIFLSNLGQKEEIEKGMSLGAYDFIIKAHHTPTEVVNKVKKLLNI